MEGEKADCCSSRQHRSALAQGRQVQERDPGQASTLAGLNKPLPVCYETWLGRGGGADSKAVSALHQLPVSLRSSHRSQQDQSLVGGEGGREPRAQSKEEGLEQGVSGSPKRR